MRIRMFLQKQAALYLRRSGASVMVNMDVVGNLTQRTSRGIMYGCNVDGHVFLSNGEEFIVPKGKYVIERKVQSQC